MATFLGYVTPHVVIEGPLHRRYIAASLSVHKYCAFSRKSRFSLREFLHARARRRKRGIGAHFLTFVHIAVVVIVLCVSSSSSTHRLCRRLCSNLVLLPSSACARDVGDHPSIQKGETSGESLAFLSVFTTRLLSRLRGVRFHDVRCPLKFGQRISDAVASLSLESNGVRLQSKALDNRRVRFGRRTL